MPLFCSVRPVFSWNILVLLKIIPLSKIIPTGFSENRTTLGYYGVKRGAAMAENRTTFSENRTTFLKIVHRNSPQSQYPCGFQAFAVYEALTKGKSLVKYKSIKESLDSSPELKSSLLLGTYFLIFVSSKRTYVRKQYKIGY